MTKVKQLLKTATFLLALLIGQQSIVAQIDSLDVFTAFIECVESAPEFDSQEALDEWIEENCVSLLPEFDDDDWGNDDWDDEWEDDDWTLEEEIEFLIEIGFGECLEGQEFDSIDALYAYIDDNCEDNWDFPDGDWDDDDWEFSLEDEIAYLMSIGFAECLEGQEFDSVEALYTFIEENCEDVLVDCPGDDYDDWTLEDEIAWLTEIGLGDCIDGQEFDSIDALYIYIDENCEDAWDFPDGDWDDEYSLEDEIAYLIEMGFGECLEGQEFDSFDALYTYLEENCEDDFEFPDGDWDDEFTLEDEIAYLIENGFGECLEGQEFDSFEALYEYLIEECEEFDDGFGMDTIYNDWTLEDELEWLIEAGYGDCIEGEEFASIEDLYEFLEDNCEDIFNPWDGEWTVEDEINILIELGYEECLGDAQFDSIEALYDYLEENCAEVFEPEIPDCLLDAPMDATFQEYLIYMSENCGDDFGFGLPDCVLDVPLFDTDDEFMAYLMENCDEFFVFDDGDDDGGEAMAAGETMYNTYRAQQFQNSGSQETTGIQNIELNLELAPNPAVSSVYFNGTETIENASVYSVQGRLMTEINVKSTQLELDVTSFHNGYYIVVLEFESGLKQAGRFLKQ